MDPICQEMLDRANKLIFVRKYDEADSLLKQCLMLPGHSEEPLVHLRRIELMSLLGRLEELKSNVSSKMGKGSQSSFWNALNCLVDLFMVNEIGDVEEILEDLKEVQKEYKSSSLLNFAFGYAFEQMRENKYAVHYYEQSLAIDHTWHPSLFGLSQVYFDLGNVEKGNQYFSQYEAMAPYNIYGNFETHRQLARDFTLERKFDEAKIAIETLTNWWVETKRYAPLEIQIFENLAIAGILDLQGLKAQSLNKRVQARLHAEEFLGQSTDENIIYFVAKILEEYGEEALSLKAFAQVLKVAGSNSSVVQKIGGQFLSAGKFEAAKELFQYAYLDHPDNKEVRFCLLVAKLKVADLNVEDYLAQRERIKLLSERGDGVELLGLLNSLLQKFTDDAEVHYHIGEIFLKMGHAGKAGKHFQKMYEVDPLGQTTRLRYAQFLMQNDGEELAMEIVNKVAPNQKQKVTEASAEIQWLRVQYYDRKQQRDLCNEALRPLLAKDPWNIAYLMQEIIQLTAILEGEEAVKRAKINWFDKLQANEEHKVDWLEFVQENERLMGIHASGLAYARAKLHYLYMRGSHHVIKQVVHAACRFDAAKGASELMKLINTNFDSPSIYWALGLVYKELWQLEVADMWFNQSLAIPGIDNREKGVIYLELADALTWRSVDLPKAIEYCRLALDLGVRSSESEEKALMVMAHAMLKHGQPRQASAFLEQLSKVNSESLEIQYLVGLVHYRNGNQQNAKTIWKPFLKYKPEIIRDHKIKQEILKYYYEGAPYAPTPLSKVN
ncbi:MAG: tetratricopeptide repeat protein [Proteobacteria bacterium]|nr:tetratricopeptide repeat protein [Pseudomonadota bacterium]